MRISARNQIKGTVVEVTKGATASHVRVDIGNGQVIVVIKASDVMIAVN
jgi:molybdopterin-binding protein